MKRTFFGTCINLLAIAAACAGLVFYIINTNTKYFSNLGRSNAVLGAIIAAMVLLLVWCLAGGATTSWKDLLPIAAPALLMYAFLTLLNSRVNGIAAVMTFENNAQNMADLKSAIVSLAALLVAALLACLASFFSVRKKKD